MSDLKDWIVEQDDEALFADGFDEAIIGIAECFGRVPVVAYDREAVIDILCEHGGDREGADEYFQYNLAGAYVGERTPVFVSSYPVSEICRLRRLLLEANERTRIAEQDSWQHFQELRQFESVVGWEVVDDIR